MRRGTTPTITISVSGIDMEDIEKWYITIAQGDFQITKTNDDIEIEDEEISILLTEEDTMQFRQGDAQIQIRAKTVDGQAVASGIQDIHFEPILLEEEILHD